MLEHVCVRVLTHHNLDAVCMRKCAGVCACVCVYPSLVLMFPVHVVIF